jgi:hypothetical protein
MSGSTALAIAAMIGPADVWLVEWIVGSSCGVGLRWHHRWADDVDRMSGAVLSPPSFEWPGAPERWLAVVLEYASPSTGVPGAVVTFGVFGIWSLFEVCRARHAESCTARRVWADVVQ